MATNVNSVTTTPIRQLNQTREVSNELGKDAFLQILITQMSNQDPLSPTSDTEFIAQMAQFSSLEQMQNMNASMQSQMNYSYLGKEISASYVLGGDGKLLLQDVFGQVEAITKVDGKDYLQVNDYLTGNTVLVPPDQVSSVMGGSVTDSMLVKIYDLLQKNIAVSGPIGEAEKKEDGTEAGEAVEEGGEAGASGDATQEAGDAADTPADVPAAGAAGEAGGADTGSDTGSDTAEGEALGL